MADENIYANFEDLSPFEIKDELIKLARAEADKSAGAFLNAGRGNPNWIATRAREAFFLLGQFALTEAKRTFEDDEVGLAGMPPRDGSYKRLKKWLSERGDDPPGAKTLEAAVDFALTKFSFEPDAFVHELTDSIIGDHYPVPDRSLVHNEAITHEYLLWAMCAGHRPNVKFDLYPVEGGTAAMCYIFKALKNQRLLNAGDTIALGTPIFTPYLEMPHLEDYDLKQIHVSRRAGGSLPAHRRGPEGAREQEGQGPVSRQSRQPLRRGAEIGDDQAARRLREHQAARPDDPDRRRLRHLRAGLRVDHGPPAAQHHRRLFVFQVFRLHRLAARRDRRRAGQHLRRDDPQSS